MYKWENNSEGKVDIPFKKLSKMSGYLVHSQYMLVSINY